MIKVSQLSERHDVSRFKDMEVNKLCVGEKKNFKIFKNHEYNTISNIKVNKRSRHLP